MILLLVYCCLLLVLDGIVGVFFTADLSFCSVQQAGRSRYSNSCLLLVHWAPCNQWLWEYWLQITICKSEQNKSLGLEVQLHIPDILVPALSEPGIHTTSALIIAFLSVISSSIRCDSICF